MVRANEELPGLVVLPAFSFSGQPRTRAQADAVAEGPNGRTVQAASDFAVRAASYPVASHVRRDGHLHYAGGLFAYQHPENTMNQWYAVAKTSQAYMVVANPVNDGCLGSSGVFTINSVDSVKPLTIGSVDTSEVVSTTLTTLGEPGAWLNQHQLIGGRRVDLVVPAILAPDSIEFKTWKNHAGYDCSLWTSYTLS